MISQQMVIALLLTASCSWLAMVSAEVTYNGQGTVYTLDTPFDGNCNFMQWPKGADIKYAALNTEQWEGAMNCGRCAEVSCTDPSCTGKPETVYIMDQCPGCVHGDLDLSPYVFESITGQSYTKLSIEWKFVDCPVSDNVQYCLKTGSSEFWVAVQPVNFVSGVASMSINGQKTSIIDSAFYFLIDGDGKSVADLSSVSISLESMSGEVLEDTLSLAADGCTNGRWQFDPSGDTSQSVIKTIKKASTNFAQEEASSSSGLYSTAAIVAAVCVGLGVVGGVVMVALKKRTRLEESKAMIIDDRASLKSYVSIHSPKCEVPAVHSAV